MRSAASDTLTPVALTNDLLRKERPVKNSYVLFTLAATIALIGYGPRPGHRIAAAQASTGTARIVAKVSLNGTAPAPAKLDMKTDPNCDQMNQAAPALSQVVEVGAGGALKDVLVFVQEGVTGAYPAPTTPVKLDQVRCQYVPHTLGVMVGQPVLYANSDATLHNIHPMVVTNTAFNIGLPIQGMKHEKAFTKPEGPIQVKCDVHSWMSANIGVFTNPFFGVSNQQGEVELKNLPAGTFQVRAWQEKYGAQTQSVTVADGETKQITFTFKAS